MKILHSADWHIGKILHKHSLHSELELFFNWLIAKIKKEGTDLLLIAGDIFDIANPSIADKEIYYKFLSNCSQLKLRLVIIGGNHDSIGMLNAPAQILQRLNISIIGGATENLEDELIEVYNKKGDLALIVAAVPFLRDKNLRKLSEDQSHANRIEALRKGIENHYQRLGELCEKKYPGIPALAMGHLYARGSLTSESERDIHIGNEAAIEAKIFPSVFQYVALGHIHRPQIIGKNEMIRYSGSPIALSFSERKNDKCILSLELNDGKFTKPEVEAIPKFRELKKYSGTLEEVTKKLEEYNPTFELPSLVEVEIKEDQFSTIILEQVSELIQSYQEHTSFKILKNRVLFNKGSQDTSELFDPGKNIEDLTPEEIFEKRIESEEMEPETKTLLQETFKLLLEEVHQNDVS